VVLLLRSGMVARMQAWSTWVTKPSRRRPATVLSVRRDEASDEMTTLLAQMALSTCEELKR
jgi:hypothetical protein